jgi:hypothetical protein
LVPPLKEEGKVRSVSIFIKMVWLKAGREEKRGGAGKGGANEYPNSEQQLPHWLPTQVALPLLGLHMAFVDTIKDGNGLDEVLFLVADEVVLLTWTEQVPKPVW